MKGKKAGGRTRFFCPKCGLRYEGRKDSRGRVRVYDRGPWNGKTEDAVCVRCEGAA